MHRAVPVLLMLALLLQHLMLPLLPGRVAQQAGKLAHVWTHADGVEHHHHRGGDMHADTDGRDDAVVHVHSDVGATSQAAVLTPAMLPPDLPGSDVRPGYTPPFHPDPAPDGLLRPPRILVG